MLSFSRPLALTAALFMASASVAMAQTPASPAAGQSLSAGPPVPGLCVLSREAVIANTKVGQAVSARLKTLTDQAQAEVNGERGPLEAEAKAMSGLSGAQLKARQDALAPRLAALQQKAAQRSREIEATQAKALNRVAQELQPVVVQVYKSHNCGILFSRDAMLGGNPSADLTAAVVQGLDARITTITFDRETLAAAATPAATARP
jgi:Skp family chaperone for outer membrane proteins